MKGGTMEWIEMEDWAIDAYFTGYGQKWDHIVDYVTAAQKTAIKTVARFAGLSPKEAFEWYDIRIVPGPNLHGKILARRRGCARHKWWHRKMFRNNFTPLPQTEY